MAKNHNNDKNEKITKLNRQQTKIVLTDIRIFSTIIYGNGKICCLRCVNVLRF